MSTTEAVGPELDAAIAQEVFGYLVVGNAFDSEPGRLHMDRRDGHGPIFRLPPYSTDISAAWSVVEMLAELGYHIHVTYRGGGNWRAWIAPPWMSGPGESTTAPNATETLVRAALAAVRAGKEQP